MLVDTICILVPLMLEKNSVPLAKEDLLNCFPNMMKLLLLTTTTVLKL